MRWSSRRLLSRSVCASLACITALAVGAPTASALTVTTFTEGISADSPVGAITSGPDGNIWFTKSTASTVGRITPSGVVTEFSAGLTAPAGEITPGPDGNVWFSETKKIGRITPAGVVTEFATDPGDDGLWFSVVAGPDGNLWFTGALLAGPIEDWGPRVGRITPAGQVTLFSEGLPAVTNNIPATIVSSAGLLWFVYGSRGPVVRVIPGPGPVTISEMPAFASGRGITGTPDGNIWFADNGRVARMTQAGVVTAFQAGLSGEPGAMTSTPDGNVWFLETVSGLKRLARITPAGVITEFPIAIDGGGRRGITVGPDGSLWIAGTDRIIRVALDPPGVTIGEPQAVTLREATLTGTVNPRNDPTAYYFEYGPTTAYGSQTSAVTAGQGATPGDVGAPVAGLEPETTYHYRLVATNSGGQTTASEDRTFTTLPNLDRDGDSSPRPVDCDDNNAAIHPGAIDVVDNDVDEDCDGVKALNLDRDGDGHKRPEDCDDANPAIHRGVPERRGNDVDEDCDGIKLPFLRITSGIQRLFVPSGRNWITKKLVVRDAPVGATAEVRCRGRGCPRKPKKLRSKGAKELRFTPYLADRRLRPGVVVEVRVTMPDRIGKLARYVMRAKRPPVATVLCLPPGQTKPGACPPGS